MIGVLAMGMAVTASHTGPLYSRALHSAQRFQQYFRELDGSTNSLNTVERLMLSFILANTRAPQPQCPEMPAQHHT